MARRLGIIDTSGETVRQVVAQSSGPTTGPRPSNWSGVVEHEVADAASTYAFQFGERNLWKIGHVQDLEGRLDDVNRHIPIELTGEGWEPALFQRGQDSLAAYAMEQKVLDLLSARRAIGERVLCSKGELEAAWASAVVAVRSSKTS